MESKSKRDDDYEVKEVGRKFILISNKNKNNNNNRIYQKIVWIESAFVGWAGEAGGWVAPIEEILPRSLPGNPSSTS